MSASCKITITNNQNEDLSADKLAEKRAALEETLAKEQKALEEINDEIASLAPADPTEQQEELLREKQDEVDELVDEIRKLKNQESAKRLADQMAAHTVMDKTADQEMEREDEGDPWDTEVLESALEVHTKVAYRHFETLTEDKKRITLSNMSPAYAVSEMMVLVKCAEDLGVSDTKTIEEFSTDQLMKLLANMTQHLIKTEPADAKLGSKMRKQSLIGSLLNKANETITKMQKKQDKLTDKLGNLQQAVAKANSARNKLGTKAHLEEVNSQWFAFDQNKPLHKSLQWYAGLNLPDTSIEGGDVSVTCALPKPLFDQITAQLTAFAASLQDKEVIETLTLFQILHLTQASNLPHLSAANRGIAKMAICAYKESTKDMGADTWEITETRQKWIEKWGHNAIKKVFTSSFTGHSKLADGWSDEIGAVPATEIKRSNARILKKDKVETPESTAGGAMRQPVQGNLHAQRPDPYPRGGGGYFRGGRGYHYNRSTANRGGGQYGVGYRGRGGYPRF